MEVNTCTILTEGIRVVAAYSHLVPAAVMIFLGVYAVVKTRFTQQSVIFLFFTLAVSLWLLGDVVLWTIPDYYLVLFFWSWLDLVNVAFFALGAYFFAILARGDISVGEKIFIFVMCLPAFAVTVSGSAITGFEQVWCEATENPWITYYKLAAEWIFIVMMFVSLFLGLRKTGSGKRTRLVVMFLAILMFFGTFSVTEYIAVKTGVYETHLYALFILPLFLIVVTFSITNLGVFNIRYLGTQLLVYVLILMVGSQFLFLQDSTDLTLNIITLVTSIFLGLVLLQNSKRELVQKELAQNLATELAGTNAKLERLDKMKSEFLSIASHQLRSPLTSIRGYVSMVLEGSYGEVNPKAAEVLNHVSDAARHMAFSIEDYLNVSRIEAGNMKYDLADVDVSTMVQDIVAEMMPVATKRGMPLVLKPQFTGPAMAQLDIGKTRQIVQNLIDNALKYTQDRGTITVVIRKDEAKKQIFIDVIDQGIGISADQINALFEKFERAKNASHINVTGTGLGLYIARTMARAMKGDITVASEGEGKGSTFTVTFPLNGIESKWTSDHIK